MKTEHNAEFDTLISKLKSFSHNPQDLNIDEILNDITLLKNRDTDSPGLNCNLDETPIGYVSFDENFHILDSNRRFRDICGLENETLKDRPIRDIIAPDSADDFIQHSRTLIETGITEAAEIKFIHNGRTVITKMESLLYTDPGPVGVRSIFTDITKEKESERLIRIERDLMAFGNRCEYIDSIMSRVLETTLEISGLFCSSLWLNQPPDNQLKLVMEKHRDDAPSCFTGHTQALIKKYLANLEKQNKPFVHDLVEVAGKDLNRDMGVEYFIILPVNQKKSWTGYILLASTEIVRLKDSHQSMLLTVANEMGFALEKDLAQQRVVESEERYSKLVENMNELVYRYELVPHSGFSFVSRSSLKITGYTPEEFYSDPHFWAKLVHPSEREKLTPFAAGTFNPEETITFKCIHKNGTPLWVRQKNLPVYNEEGDIIALDGIAQDISAEMEAEAAQEQLQRQLIQAQKMESVGRLAGGIAHDFNNLLQGILGYTTYILGKLDSGHPVYKPMKEIERAALRTGDLTRQLLAFARQQVITPKVLDINETIAGLLKMLKRLIGEHIELDWNPGEDIYKLRIDPSQIDQILANLTVNARDAIHSHGKIVIETENVTVTPDLALQHPGLKEGRYVCIRIGDNGHGMDEHVVKQIFEPFFTTKDVGQGTGLGLSTVYGIVKQNQGYVDVTSEPEKGTTFTIYFHEYRDESAAESSPDRDVTSSGGHEVILLIEDDPMILEATTYILEDLGYEVIGTQNPDEAIETMEKNSSGIDLVLTDVIMPRMNGRELADRLKSIDPDLNLLYMSGYTSDIIAQHGFLNKDTKLISKPFTRVEIDNAIRSILNGTNPGNSES